MEVRFLMLIGIAGSGKSTIAKKLMEERDDIVHLSSDSIREELYGDENVQKDPAKVFALMEERALEAFKNGKHVIYDATNIKRKERVKLINKLPKGVHKTALYVATHYDVIVKQNNSRKRVVPQEVIDRMYKNLQLPIYSEGWDNIAFNFDDLTFDSEFPKQFSDAVRAGVLLNREGYELMEFMATYFKEFLKVLDLPQDSKYHNLSVSRHIYYVYKHVLDNYETEDETEKELMLWTALLHDIGKAFCKSFKNRQGEETRYANFIGHEHVSAQIATNILRRLGFSDQFIYNSATLIQFHMYLLDAKASEDKLKRYVGEDMFKKLEFLRDADNLAH